MRFRFARQICDVLGGVLIKTSYFKQVNLITRITKRSDFVSMMRLCSLRRRIYNPTIAKHIYYIFYPALTKRPAMAFKSIRFWVYNLGH